MWRCASRGIAGLLGTVALHQCPVLADSSIAANAAGAAFLSTSIDPHTDSSSNASAAASTTTQHQAAGQQLHQQNTDPATNNRPQKPGLPRKIEQGAHFAVLDGSQGTPSTLSRISAAMQAADVVFLGEYHDDPVAHALQLGLLKRAAKHLGYHQLPNSHNSNSSREPGHQQQPSQQQHEAQQQDQQQQEPGVPLRPLVLSLEMFDRDVQTVIDEYLAGFISLRDFLRDSRPWPNYTTDYAPLVNYCKQHGVKVIAANAPRRYVSLAGRSSRAALSQLPAEAQAWLAPLPYDQPSQRYVDKVQSSMQQAAQEMQKLRQKHTQQEQQAEQEQQQQQQQQMRSGLTAGNSTSNDTADTGSTQEATLPTTPVPAAASDAMTAGAPAAAVAEPPGACPYIGFNVSSNFIDAQVLWDATMAYSIAQQLQWSAADPDPKTSHNKMPFRKDSANPDIASPSPTTTAEKAPLEAPNLFKPLVIHVCGKFHCEERLGIPEHLASYAPGTRMLCVVFVPSKSMSLTAEEFKRLGLQGLADFVVLTAADLPRSFDTVHPV